MSSKKPKKADIRRQPSLSSIKRQDVKIPEGVSFSFMYYQDDKDKFSLANRDAIYLASLLRRLRDLSQLNSQEIINNQSKSLRCHSMARYNGA